MIDHHSITVALLLAALPLSLAHARSVELFLGDTNTTHNGAGSPDDVYVDRAWAGQIALANWPGPLSDFDVSRVDHNVPFTFLFTLHPDERVVAATLTLSLRSTYTEVSTDGVLLDSVAGSDVYDYADMGWLPLPGTGTHLRSINLASTLGRNALPLLQDGQLNVLVRDDSFVNHATLSLLISFLPGDTNADGVVDLADLNAVLNHFGSPGPAGDDNADGTVDLHDLNAVLNHFGNSAPTTALAALPEPASLACLVPALPLLARRRRHP